MINHQKKKKSFKMILMSLTFLVNPNLGEKNERGCITVCIFPTHSTISWHNQVTTTLPSVIIATLYIEKCI